MSVAEHNRRFARHLLLAEIGEAGQARLCTARTRLAPSADARVASVARDYLVRAGVAIATEHEPTLREELSLADAAGVRALAGRVELEEAAAALLGAFAAVEAIKRVVGAGTPATLPAGLQLDACAAVSAELAEVIA